MSLEKGQFQFKKSTISTRQKIARIVGGLLVLNSALPWVDSGRVQAFGAPSKNSEVTLDDINHSWDVLRIGADRIQSANLRPIKVAVLDTGIDASSAIFQGRIDPGVNVILDNLDVTDESGHGTMVSGVIAKDCPNCRIKPYKIIGKSSGYITDAINGMQLAAADGARIINASFGTPLGYYSQEICNKVTDVINQGVIIVAAVGNNGATTADVASGVTLPASCPGVLAVGSFDQSNLPVPSSNFSPRVDILAPGNDILTISPGDQQTLASGTSLATPAVTGSLGVILGQSNMSNNEAINLIQTYAKPSNPQVARDRPHLQLASAFYRMFPAAVLSQLVTPTHLLGPGGEINFSATISNSSDVYWEISSNETVSGSMRLADDGSYRGLYTLGPNLTDQPQLFRASVVARNPVNTTGSAALANIVQDPWTRSVYLPGVFVNAPKN